MADYLRMRDKFYQAQKFFNYGSGQNFFAGFYAGQMEKVMAGACRFCMFRPREDEVEEKFALAINELANIYGLVVHRLPNVPEHWCCLKENEGDFFDLLEMEPDSPSWHRQRGRMCGIARIDEQYHLRTGGEHG